MSNDLTALLERVRNATEWRLVPGWPYEASNTGVLRSILSGKPIVPTITHNGYEKCTFQVDNNRRDVRVHRAVAEAWIGTIGPGMVVNHLDADKLNNSPCNLEITTPSGNEAHAVSLGLKASGARNGTHTKPYTRVSGSRQGLSKLKEENIPVIRGKIMAGESLAQISRHFGVSKQVIWGIKEGKLWKNA